MEYTKECANTDFEDNLFSCTSNIERYKCDFCSHFQTNYLTHLQQHIEKEHLRSYRIRCQYITVYKCPNCNFDSYSRYLAISHKCNNNFANNDGHKHFETKSEGYKCQYCEYMSPWISELVMHIFQKHEKSQIINSFECGHCSMRYPLKKNIYSHTLCKHIKHEQLPWLYCNLCKYRTKGSSNLKNHISMKHPSEENTLFKCPQCSTSFKTRRYLQRHIRLRHTKPKEGTQKFYSCNNCNYKAEFQYLLRKHITNIHLPDDQIRWFTCEKCPFKAKQRKGLVVHVLKEHTDEEKLFQCEHCPYRAIFKHKVTEHQKVHIPDDKATWFKCEFCPHQTKYKRSLKSHVLFVHSSPDKIQWFPCGNCDFKSKYKSDLKVHMEKRCRTLKKKS